MQACTSLSAPAPVLCRQAARVPTRAGLVAPRAAQLRGFAGGLNQAAGCSRAFQPALRPGRRASNLQVHASAGALEPQPKDAVERTLSKFMGPSAAASATTLTYIAIWYGLNVAFNLQNKVIFNYFPYPWFVSSVHVVVGTIYCAVFYLIGLKKASFERPITTEELGAISGPAAMHAIGHVAANLSFAAVAISLTHTVKTLEPAFNVALSQLILGQSTPAPVILSLIPVMVGVAAASAADLSFNWTGFISAMVSNLTFGFRAVWSKKAMTTIKNLSSTGIYAYTTLISVFICVPGIFFFERGVWSAIRTQVALKGAGQFYGALLSVGLLYHLYNQFAFNTLSRISPVSHGVCNVVKRVVIIATSVLFFGNKLTLQTKVGTGIALLGTYAYTEAVKRYKATPTPKLA
ncbi:TPT3 [Auxenochlorella protothecoides x Auxenochlorella symbiontica]